MVSACCAFGCTYRHKKEFSIGLFRFPKESSRRQAWIQAIRRKNWQPTSGTRICGLHFQTGRPNKDKDHPDYVPNVFCYTKGTIRSAKQCEEMKRQEAKLHPKIIILKKSCIEESDDTLPTISTVDGSFVAEENSKDSGNNDSEFIIQGDVEPKITMSLSAYQNTISKLKAENERLQGEVRRLKIDNMVDIALEMSTLRDEIRTLKEKLTQAQFSTLLLSDIKKFQHYTGIQDFETFNNMVLSSKDLIDTSFSIPEETQLLIVLVKLKMKFQDEDLAVRFNVSRRTDRRVIETWLPILSLES